MALRDDLLAKYGVSTSTPSRGTSGGSSNSLREELLAKYLNKTTDSDGRTIYKSRTVEDELKKAEEERKKREALTGTGLDRFAGQTISQAPEKSFLQKVGGAVKSGLQKIGILQSEKDKLARDQVVTGLTQSLNDRQYLEIGKALNLNETLKPTMPEGVDAPPGSTTYNYYQNKEIVEQVKNNFPEYKQAFGIEDPDQLDREFVDKNLDAITKEMGVRTQLTNKEYAGLMLTLGLGVGVAAPIALGAKFLPTVTKAGLGLAGFEALSSAERKINKFVTGNEESFAETATRAAGLGPTGEGLIYAVDLFAKGGILYGVFKKSPKVAEKFTKDTIEKHNMPQTVYIQPEKVKSIFQTGEKISAQELDMVKSLGLDGKGYRNAMKNGVTVEVPAEKLVMLVDKPYWSKAKKIFGFESIPETISRSSGKPTQGVRGYLEGPSGKPVSTATRLPAENSPRVAEALQSPVNKKLLGTIEKFSEVEASAFGKRLLERINTEVGTKLKEGDAPNTLAGAIKVNEMESPDGRPAQFNNQGKIEVFLPNLVKDLKTLAGGGRILAHEGAYSKVYELKDGESMNELAVRYVKDILVHEKSHEKTVSLEDITKSRQLQDAVNQARASKNKTALDSALAARDQHMKMLEEKALEYERGNRAQLEKDLFGTRGPSTDLQRAIDRGVKGGKENKVTVSEKKLLKTKLKAQAAGSKSGKAAGREIGRRETAEVRTQYQAMIKKVRSDRDSVQSKRDALAEYATAFLPMRSRGKFLKAVKNMQTEKEFLATIQRMQKEADLVARKTLMTDITKELKGTIIKSKDGFPNVKFEREAQKKLNTIRANIKGDYLNAQNKIADLVADFQTKNPEATLPEEIVSEIQLLKMVGIQDMTAKELRSVLADVKSIKENGRTLKELERFNRESEIQAARDKIYDLITGGKPLPSEAQSIRQREKDTFAKKVADFDKNQRYAWEELLDVLSVRDKGSKQYESFLSRYGMDRTNKAFNEQNFGEMRQIEKVNTKMKDIYGVSKNKDVLALLNDLKQVQNYGKIVHADGVERNLEISRGQAIQMEMWLRDPTLEGSFTEGLKWGEAVIDTVRTQVLKPEDFKMADELLEYYRGYYERINETFSKEYGTDLPFNEFYSPVHRDVDVLIPENVLLAQEMQKYATAKNNSLKNRVKNNVELKTTDAFENLQRHIAKMEHYIAWSEPMFEFRRVFGNKDVRKSIQDLHGDTTLKILDNFLNDFARDGVSREKVVRGVDDFRSNATKALLGLNWRVGFKQLSGVTSYAIEMPIKDFFTGVGSFWTDPLNKARFLYKNSSTLQERFGSGFERDIKFAIQKDYDKTLAKTKNWSEMMFILIRNADKFTVYQGSWAAYRMRYGEVIRKGGTEKEAREAGIKHAENLTNRVQESSRLDTLAPLQRAGSWAKLFTMFQSQPSKFNRIIVNAMRNYRAGRGSKATHVKRVIFAAYIAPLIYAQFSNLIAKEEYKKSQGQMFAESLLGPLTYPLIFGQMFQSAYGWTTGERFSYTPSAAFAFMDDIQRGIQEMKTGDIVEATTYLIDTVGKLSGVPSTIFTRPLRNSLKEEDSGPEGVTAEF